MGSHYGEGGQGNRGENKNHWLDVVKADMLKRQNHFRVYSLVLLFWCCEATCVSLARSLFHDFAGVF